MRRKTSARFYPNVRLRLLKRRRCLGRALDAIVCFHRDGFVHGRLTPANIMAVSDRLKLSSDNLRRIGDWDLPRLRGANQPPEVAAGGKLSPAGDIWTLGVTLVEVLTQRRPAWMGTEGELVLPDGVAEPLLDIVRHCLRPHAQERWTAAEMIVPLKAGARIPKESRARWYAVAAVAFAIAILAVWFGRPSTDTARPSAAPAPEAASSNPPARTSMAQAPSPAPSRPSARRAASEPSAPLRSASPSSSQSAPPAPDVSSSPATSAQAPEPAQPAASPRVVNQVMPDVLAKARRSIRGKVSVGVRVHVDAYGNVSEATLEPPPVSHYFSGVTMKAVRRWKFRPVREGEVYVAQEWIVRFEFTRSNTKVAVERVAP